MAISEATRTELVEEVRRLRARIAELETGAGPPCRHLCESNSIGVFVTDRAGNVIEANEVFLEKLGYGPEDLPLECAEPEPTRPASVDSEKSDLSAEIPDAAAEPVAREFVRRDGGRVSILVGAGPSPTREGERVHLGLDLTRTRRAENALRESETRYRDLYDNIPLMYFTLDAEGTVEAVNSYGAAQLGYRPDELVGRPVLEVFHPEDHEPVAEQLRTALAHPGEAASWRFRKIRKDGSLLWVQEAVRVVERAGRSVVLVVCEDITDRVEAEGKVKRYKSELRHLASELVLAEERERRRIAEGLHDQLGQLLATAKLELGALREPGTAGEGGGGRELRKLLNRALEETRELTFELSCPVLYELGLEAALEDLCERVSPLGATRLDFVDDRRSKPLGEDSQVILFRVVRELLFNIGKHSRARYARLAVSRSNGEILISVEDDGIGIDRDALERLPSEAGGIGLFNARERLAHLGGRLEIDSSPGGGTRIVVAAPLEGSSDSGPDTWSGDPGLQNRRKGPTDRRLVGTFTRGADFTGRTGTARAAGAAGTNQSAAFESGSRRATR